MGGLISTPIDIPNLIDSVQKTPFNSALSSTKRSLIQRFSDYVNALDYCNGDGTDDLANFQRMISEANNAGRHIIVPTPSVEYYVSSGNILIPSGMKIWSPSRSKIRIGNTLNPLFNLGAGSYQLIRGLRLVGCASNLIATIIGDQHSNTVIDNIASITNLAVGQYIVGLNIPNGTTITSISGSGPYSITLSKATTATAAAVVMTTSLNNSNTGSCAITSSPGVSYARVEDCQIENWTRHGIVFDGDHCEANDNYVSFCYYGAGILFSATTTSVGCSAVKNTVMNTQEGNIQAFNGAIDWLVDSNYCAYSGVGSTIAASGTIADNITGYSPDNSRIRITNNACVNSGNNGMHVAGDNGLVMGNTITIPKNMGICYWKYPNTAPPSSQNIRIIGNHIEQDPLNKTTAGCVGIGIRSVVGGIVAGNTGNYVYELINLAGLTNSGNGVIGVNVVDNEATNVVILIHLRHRVNQCSIKNNKGRSGTVGILIENDTSLDGTSNPCFYNEIVGNAVELFSSYTVQETAGNFNLIADNTTPNGAVSYQITGAGSVLRDMPIVSIGLTAAGTTQATALILTGTKNTITAVAAGSGVQLRAAHAGRSITIINASANSLLIYPASTSTIGQTAAAQINGLGVNSAYSLAAGAKATFDAESGTQWRV